MLRCLPAYQRLPSRVLQMSKLSNALAREKRLRDLAHDAAEWMRAVGSETKWYRSLLARLEKAAR